jgi:hypothetical protein
VSPMPSAISRVFRCFSCGPSGEFSTVGLFPD